MYVITYMDSSMCIIKKEEWSSLYLAVSELYKRTLNNDFIIDGEQAVEFSINTSENA